MGQNRGVSLRTLADFCGLLTQEKMRTMSLSVTGRTFIISGRSVSHMSGALPWRIHVTRVNLLIY